MEEKARRRGLNWSVDSAGTGNWHIGEKPDSRSRAVARKYGIDISNQRARQFSAADLDAYDLVLAMDRNNLQHIQNQGVREAHQEKAHLIMELAHPGSGADIPDPYWDDDGFEIVYDMLNKACDRIIDQLVKE